MRHKLLTLVLAVAMIVSLVVVGCAKPAPAPPPTPPPTPAPAPAPAPPHEQVAIDILGIKFGGSGYIVCFALADLINKHSPWLRATAMESEGTIQNLRLLAEEPERRKYTVTYATTSSNYLATQGLPPFEAPYTGAKAISLAQWVVHSYVTFDPNIKTGWDFEGKRIALPSKGSAGRLEPEILMEYAWNVKDKVKLDYLGWSGSINALRDGLADVSIANPIYVGKDKVAPNPALQELMASRADYHYISISKEDINTAREKSGGFPIYAAELPGGALGPKQPEPLGIAKLTNGWFADTELPDDVVYEVCRIIYEYHEEFWPFHASLQGLIPEVMPKQEADEAGFHPGAVRFYKDKGLEIGFPTGG